MEATQNGNQWRRYAAFGSMCGLLVLMVYAMQAPSAGYQALVSGRRLSDDSGDDASEYYYYYNESYYYYYYYYNESYFYDFYYGDSEGDHGCILHRWKGDGFCDDMNNKPDCDWDGGDCCDASRSQEVSGNFITEVTWSHFCRTCECLDPNPQPSLPTLGSSRNADGKAPAGKKKWTEIGANLECDGYDGEVYLESSQGKVPTLAECKESCESAKECTSISYFKSGWCSHWSTACKKTRFNKKVAVSLKFTVVPDTATIPKSGKAKWIEIGAKLECDGYNGEVYLESSRGKVPTLAECKKSCQSAEGCKSISYFNSGWCSHWSTTCKKTKFNNKVAVSLELYHARLRAHSGKSGDDKAKAGSGDKAKAGSGDKAKAGSGDKAKADSGDKAKAGSGDKAKAGSGDKAKADSGDKAKADNGDKAKADKGKIDLDSLDLTDLLGKGGDDKAKDDGGIKLGAGGKKDSFDLGGLSGKRDKY